MGSKTGLYLGSSLMRKFVIGLSGLFMCLFIAGHVVGNTLLIISPEMFNKYGHALVSNPAIYLIELIVVGFLLTHIIMAITVTLQNINARPTSYKITRKSFSLPRIASNTMIYSGLLILTFLIFHIVQIKYGTHYYITYDGVEIRDLHRLMLEYFSSQINVAGYIVAMILVSLHVLHGFWSIFQSLGIIKERYDTFFRVIASIFALFILVSYITFPLWCYLQGVN